MKRYLPFLFAFILFGCMAANMKNIGPDSNEYQEISTFVNNQMRAHETRDIGKILASFTDDALIENYTIAGKWKIYPKADYISEIYRQIEFFERYDYHFTNININEIKIGTDEAMVVFSFDLNSNGADDARRHHKRKEYLVKMNGQWKSKKIIAIK